MFVVLQLLRNTAEQPPVVLAMCSRRESMPDTERRHYEALLEAIIEPAAPRAQLVFDAALSTARVASADTELSAYLGGVLALASPCAAGESKIVREVRTAIGDQLLQGTPTTGKVARALGLGQRTLQRRLGERAPRNE